MRQEPHLSFWGEWQLGVTVDLKRVFAPTLDSSAC
jgi:hypothetical protein